MPETTTPPHNPKEKAEELLNSLRKGKSTYDLFAETFRRQYLIAGKTLEGWEKEFRITIPTDISIETCKAIDMQLMKLHQEASFHKATADAVVQALKKGSETEYRSRFTGLVAEYNQNKQKLPASATLEALARTQIDDVDAALMSAHVAADFWQGIIEHLTFCRKLLELGTMSLGIEAKALQNERYIDTLNRKVS